MGHVHVPGVMRYHEALGDVTADRDETGTVKDCNRLQPTAIDCNALQHTAAHCNWGGCWLSITCDNHVYKFINKT